MINEALKMTLDRIYPESSDSTGRSSCDVEPQHGWQLIYQGPAEGETSAMSDVACTWLPEVDEGTTINGDSSLSTTVKDGRPLLVPSRPFPFANKKSAAST